MSKVVLLIDDEELVARAIGNLLEKSGCKVFFCLNGADALKIVEQSTMDLVICDVRMPILTGLDTVRQIRSFQPNVPVLFITGFANEKTEKEAMDLRPIAYLHKPFDIKQILSVVSAME